MSMRYDCDLDAVSQMNRRYATEQSNNGIVHARRQCQATICSDGSASRTETREIADQWAIEKPTKEDDGEHLRTSCSVDQRY